MASVNTSGNAFVGESFSLLCSITRALNTNGNLTLQWIGPDRNSVVSMGSILVGDPLTSGAETSLALHFNTLFSSHGGEYICQGNLVDENNFYTVSALEDLIIQGQNLVLSVPNLIMMQTRGKK